MLSEQANYKAPLLISLVIHAVLIAALLIDFNFNHAPAVLAQGQDKVEIIQAVAINQHKLSAEVNKVLARQQAKQRQELAKQQQLQQQHEQEQQRVAQLQKKAAELEQQQAAEQQRLQQIKQQNDALAQQRQQEQQRLAALALQHKQAEEQQAADAAAAKQKALAEQQQAEAEAKAKQKALAEAKRKAVEVAKKQALADAKRKAAAVEAAAEAKLQDELAGKEAQFARTQGIVNKYQALIRQAIGQQWIVPPNADKSLSCKFQIRVAPGGGVIAVTLLRSSGDPVLDRSAQNAIYKASPLPVPSDKDAFDVFRSFSLIVRPEGAIAG